MGATNTEDFTVTQNNMAKLARALGHPARIAIMELLVRNGPGLAGDIVKALPLAQPTVSQHLKEMKTAGLIKDTIKGNTVSYSVDEPTLQKLREYFGDMYLKLRER